MVRKVRKVRVRRCEALKPRTQRTSRTQRTIRTVMSVFAFGVTALAQQSTNWTTFSYDYTGQRHSPLTQITPTNVARLAPQWLFQTDVPGFPGRGLENSPLIVDGVAYVTGNNNQ